MAAPDEYIATGKRMEQQKRRPESAVALARAPPTQSGRAVKPSSFQFSLANGAATASFRFDKATSFLPVRNFVESARTGIANSHEDVAGAGDWRNSNLETTE